MNEKLTLDELANITLTYGAHKDRETGLCVMEAVAWFAGEPHADHPKCACPVLTSFAIRLNDRITDDAERTRIMRPLIPRLANTRRTKELETRRGYIAADFAVRDCAPRALDSAAEALARRGEEEHAKKCTAFAKQLRELPEVVDKATGNVAAKLARAASDAFKARVTGWEAAAACLSRMIDATA